MLTLNFVLETLGYQAELLNEIAISSVAIDSRLTEPGSLFVAFRGENSDGHDFVADAFENGAVAALVEEPVSNGLANIDLRALSTVEHPNDFADESFCILVDSTLDALQKLGRVWRSKFSSIRVIGITGSVGKTTTKELTHVVLCQQYSTLKSEGNYNNEIGLPLTLLQIRPEHERVVLEMGMYTQGEIALLCQLASPQVGVVTIVGSVHMEWLGSIEAIAAAKQELIEHLPPVPEGIAILNMDDALVMAMADHTEARIFTYGLDPSADLWAENIVSMGLDGIRFTLHYRSESLSVQVPLLGRHSVHTALRAVAVGLVEGMEWQAIVSGLHSLTSQLRLVAVPGPRDSIILDDTYNSSPESAVAALNLLGDLSGRRIAVLGDMLELGPVEEISHRLVGRRVKDVAHLLIAVGQLGALIGEEAVRAGMGPDDVYFLENTDEAVETLNQVIEEGDVILVKGSQGAHLDTIVAEIGLG